MAYKLIDIGANLTHDSFDSDRVEVLERARSHGVEVLIVTGATVAGSMAALELAKRHPGRLFATAGVHPHHAKDLDEDGIALLGEMLREPETVSAGECGLDYFRNFSTREQQERAFSMQLELADAHKVPVFLHQRDAHEEVLELLRPHLDAVPRAVAHCFTGGERELGDLLELDLYIGITGWICDERRGKHLREVVRQIPRDRLLLETDAPYLLPRDLDPKPGSRRNEPMYLEHILETIAECRQEDPRELAQVTSANARRFFSLPEASEDAFPVP